VQDLHGLGLTQVGGEIDQLLIAHIEALRGTK
jgi:hypothetical protein